MRRIICTIDLPPTFWYRLSIFCYKTVNSLYQDVEGKSLVKRDEEIDFGYNPAEQPLDVRHDCTSSSDIEEPKYVYKDMRLYSPDTNWPG